MRDATIFRQNPATTDRAKALPQHTGSASTLPVQWRGSHGRRCRRPQNGYAEPRFGERSSYPDPPDALSRICLIIRSAEKAEPLKRLRRIILRQPRKEPPR